MKVLSYTQIELYGTCPLCYRLQYIDGLKPKDKWQFSFGSSLHLAAEYLFKVRLPQPPSLKALIDFYEKNWQSEGYISPEEEASYRRYGTEILTRFWEIHAPNFRLPLAVEYPFYIDIEGVKLRGFIDRVDKLETGNLEIIDYKSNYRMFTRDDLEENLQLSLYQLAAEKRWFLPVERLTLYHLRSNTPCSSPARNKSRLDEAKSIVLETAENILRQNFPPKENEYCPCDFPEHCPYYRQKGAPPASKEEAKEVPIKERVERYAFLQARIKELEYELKEIKDLITDYCQSHRLSRVYGDKHALTYRLMERAGFDENEVRAILEPEGLWERVLSLDESRLKELLEGGEVAQSLRDKLASLRRVISAYPQLWLKKLHEEE